MAIHIKVGMDVADALRAVQALQDGLAFEDRDLIDLANLAIHRIKQRTKRGLDAAGKPFKPYTRRYASRRAKAKRRVSPVTLSYFGRMQGTMTPAAEGQDAVVFFNVATYGKIAGWHNDGTRRMAQRRWLEFDEGTRDLQMLANEAARKLAKRLEQ